MQRSDPYASLAANHFAIFPRFDEHQKRAANEAYEALVPHIRKGSIDLIVDLGCGSGETLTRLAQLLDSDERMRKRRPKPLLLVGLDSSPTLIEHARHTLLTTPLERVRCVFECCDAEALPFEFLTRILDAQGRRGEHTLQSAAVLCLGHTIFHFPYLPPLFDQLAHHQEYRPHLWLIDIYHSWDDTLLHVAQSDHGEVLEPRSFSNGTRLLNTLFTRRSQREGFVERGLLQTATGAFEDATEIIRTHQLNWTSKELIGRFSDVQYLVAHRQRGISGYGEVERLTLYQASRTFPLPALILDCKLVPLLPLAQDSDAPHEASPLSIIGDWVAETGMLDGSKENAFDFVILETAPYYSSPSGRAALKQEVIICCQPTLAERAASWLKAYRDTLHQALLCNLTPYFHPSFAGHGGGADWPPVHFSLLQGGRPDIECSASESATYHKWEYALNELISVDAEKPEEGPTELPNSNAHILVERNNTTAMAGALTDRKEGVERRLLQTHRADSLRRIDKALLERDLHLVQQFLHDRLRHAFDTPPGTSTIFIGVPLRSRYDEFRGSIDRLDGLPERYRGGVWIFARARGRYEYAQHAFIGDLARLALHLQGTAIDAQAADAVSETTLGKYAKLFAQVGMTHASGAWVQSRQAAKAVFAPGSGHHTISQWRAHLDNGTAPQQLLDLARRASARVVAVCSTDKTASLTDLQSIVFLKALFKRGVSVSFLREMLAWHGHAQARPRKRDTEILLAIPDEFLMTGGHFLYAIHSFCQSRPFDPETGEQNGFIARAGLAFGRKRLALGRKTNECLLYFDVQFESAGACQDAAEELGAAIEEARDLDGKEATSACIVLRLAAARESEERQTKWKIRLRGESRLRLMFWFTCKGFA